MDIPSRSRNDIFKLVEIDNDNDVQCQDDALAILHIEYFQFLIAMIIRIEIV